LYAEEYIRKSVLTVNTSIDETSLRKTKFDSRHRHRRHHHHHHHHHDEQTSSIGEIKSKTESITSSLFDDKNDDTTSKQEGRPFFIIHIGPAKTATTSIQCGLERISGELARLDNFYYVGNSCRVGQQVTMRNNIKSLRMYPFVLSLKSDASNLQILNETKELFDFHRRDGHHMIMSSEHFTSKITNDDGEIVWKRLSYLLEGFRVRIIIGYRHYFDLLPSMYYQEHQDEKYLQWKNEGGRHHPSFQEYLERHLGDSHTDWNVTHPSLSAFRLWTKYFTNAGFFDLHHETDTLTDFVCNMLPGAFGTCRLLKEFVNKSNTTMTKRVSSKFHAERLAEAAYDRGLLREGLVKALPVHIAKYMMNQLEVNNIDDYWSCLPPLLEDRFRNTSSSFMSSMMYLKYSTHELPLSSSLEKHNRLFEQSKSLGKFCDINTTSILSNVTLTRQFFGTFYSA
jgi:hypothetical protein